jgi:hypothetical protein
MLATPSARFKLINPSARVKLIEPSARVKDEVDTLDRLVQSSFLHSPLQLVEKPLTLDEIMAGLYRQPAVNKEDDQALRVSPNRSQLLADPLVVANDHQLLQTSW